MRNSLVAFSVLVCMSSCGPSTGSRSKTSTQANTEDGASPDGAQEASTNKRSETKDWSEVQPLESSSSGAGTSNRKSRIIVTSDPAKHGDALHFRFLVNAVPISGVFVAPGGQSTTFTIPVGTVHFTVEECGWDTQGFELAPDEEMPISCKLTKEGDCCEVAIPVEENSKEDPKKK